MMNSKDISYDKCAELGCNKFNVSFQGHDIGGDISSLIPVKNSERKKRDEYASIVVCKKHLHSDDNPMTLDELIFDIGYCDEDYYPEYLKNFQIN